MMQSWETFYLLGHFIDDATVGDVSIWGKQDSYSAPSPDVVTVTEQAVVLTEVSKEIEEAGKDSKPNDSGIILGDLAAELEELRPLDVISMEESPEQGV